MDTNYKKREETYKRYMDCNCPSLLEAYMSEAIQLYTCGNNQDLAQHCLGDKRSLTIYHCPFCGKRFEPHIFWPEKEELIKHA